jgi:hypothetical protein
MDNLFFHTVIVDDTHVQRQNRFAYRLESIYQSTKLCFRLSGVLELN